MKNYSIEEQDKIGKEIAKILILKKSKEHKDRYQMTWGNKTAFGLVETIKRIAQMLEDGEEIKS